MRRIRVVDPVVVALLGVCDGELTAGQALTAIAAVMGEDERAVREQGLVGLRRLVADGMLVQAEVADPGCRPPTKVAAGQACTPPTEAAADPGRALPAE